MDIDAPSDVVAELSVPTYFFFPSGASDLVMFLNLPYYYPTMPSFREMGKTTLVRYFSGMPPIRAVDMLQSIHDKENDATKVRLYQFKRMAEERGVLVNSFDWLEPWSCS